MAKRIGRVIRSGRLRDIESSREQGIAQRQMSLGQSGGERHRALRRRDRACIKRLQFVSLGIFGGDRGQRARSCGMRHGKIRIGRDGQIIMRERRPIGRLVARIIEHFAPAQIIFIRINIACPAGSPVRLDDTHRQRLGHHARNLALKVENVLDRTIETVGPATKPGPAVDQLGGDAQHVARPPHTAFQQECHTKPSGHGRRFILMLARSIRRCRREHPQALVARQRGADFLGQPVGKIALRRIPAKIGEGDHRNAVGNRPIAANQTLLPRQEPAGTDHRNGDPRSSGKHAAP